MLRKALVISGVLIFTYLAVSYATGAGKLLTAGSGGAVDIIKAFQGR